MRAVRDIFRSNVSVDSVTPRLLQCVTMYNKLFQQILDSSIWLESDTTRIVWITLIAAMDEDGMAHFASLSNLARRAIVTQKAAQAAVASLEGPDENSSDPENDGKRIERVPGGWIVLNAGKYRALATKIIQREKTRQRVQRFRAGRNAVVTQGNESVTRSEANPEAKAEEKASPSLEARVKAKSLVPEDESLRAGRLVERYAELYAEKRNGARYRPRPVLDWRDACELVRIWPDDRLEKLAKIVLTTDDPWVSETDRGFKIFAIKASWADDLLMAYAKEKGITL